MTNLPDTLIYDPGWRGAPLGNSMVTGVNGSQSRLGDAMTSSPQRLAARILRSIGAAVPYTLMATPPTITRGTDGANSTLTTDANAFSPPIASGDPRLTYVGGKAVSSGSGPQGTLVSSQTSPGAPSSPGLGYLVRTDAEAFEVLVQNTAGNTFRVAVDGQWTTSADITITGSGATFYYHKFDFGTGNGKSRLIEVYFSANANSCKGFNVGLSAGSTLANCPYTIFPAGLDEPRIVGFGDSWVAGTGGTNCRDNFLFQMGAAMGIRSVVASGVGGQGYMVVGVDGGNTTFRGRVNDIVLTGKPDLFVMGPAGLNDVIQNTVALQAEVGLFAAAAIALLPPPSIIVAFGPQRHPSSLVNAATALAIQTGWTTAVGWDPTRMFYVDTFNDPTGINWWGTSLTAGNWSVYNNASFPGHPNTAGHAYQGNRMAAKIRTLLESIQ